MKKRIITLTSIASLTVWALIGCSKNESGATTLDTAKLQSAFTAAAAVDKAEVEKAINAIKSSDYAAAVTSLKQAASNVKFPPEQQQAVKDLLAQAQAKLGASAGEMVDKAKTAAGAAAGEMADKTKTAAGDAAKKATDDLQKAVGK